jgi:hypothetical protein
MEASLTMVKPKCCLFFGNAGVFSPTFRVFCQNRASILKRRQIFGSVVPEIPRRCDKNGVEARPLFYENRLPPFHPVSKTPTISRKPGSLNPFGVFFQLLYLTKSQ